jgi:mono/diheme cytochrome c family protein
MIRWNRLPIVAALPVVALIAACENPRTVEPLTGFSPQPAEPALRAGLVQFMQNCHACHPNGNAGLGPAINDKPLPMAAIKAQIRLGAGKMPAFPPERLSDENADAIARYLVWLRNAAEVR